MMAKTISNEHHKIHSEEPKQSILQHLQHHPGIPAHDLMIICRDGSLMTHQVVLACVSPMLRSEMGVMTLADDILTISMPDMTKDHLAEFLAALYQCKDLSKFSAIQRMLGFNFASEFNTKCHKTDPGKSDLSSGSKLKEEEDMPNVHSFEHCSVGIESENISFNENQNYIKGESELHIEETNARRKYNVTQKERKKKSKVWENFSIDPDNPEQCVCKICHGSVSYKNGGTSSMMSHLKNEHVLLKMDQFLKDDPDVKVNKSGANGTRKKRSRVWEYFSVNPHNANQCVCVICNENVNYINKGTSSMTSHLKCEHDIWIIKFERKEPSVKRGPRKTTKKEPVIDPETGEIKKSVECRAKRRKDLWKHFDSFPNDNLKALCKICQQTIFITEKSSISQTLVKHLNTHDIKLELETCSVCGKTFEERAKRRKHEKNHQVKCSCSFCGKMFSDNTARVLHERTHTGEKPHQCSQCGRRFGQKYHLRVHMRVHTGETPYHCQTCGQSFKHLSSRNNHKCLAVNIA